MKHVLEINLKIRDIRIKNKVLGRWRKPDKCHGDILIKILNEREE